MLYIVPKDFNIIFGHRPCCKCVCNLSQRWHCWVAIELQAAQETHLGNTETELWLLFVSLETALVVVTSPATLGLVLQHVLAAVVPPIEQMRWWQERKRPVFQVEWMPTLWRMSSSCKSTPAKVLWPQLLATSTRAWKATMECSSYGVLAGLALKTC